jgi:hypothetical protein
MQIKHLSVSLLVTFIIPLFPNKEAFHILASIKADLEQSYF